MVLAILWCTPVEPMSAAVSSETECGSGSVLTALDAGIYLSVRRFLSALLERKAYDGRAIDRI
jgi:hypothetical protein